MEQSKLLSKLKFCRTQLKSRLKIQIFIKNSNCYQNKICCIQLIFCQKSKILSPIEKFCQKIEFFCKNRHCCHNSKCYQQSKNFSEKSSPAGCLFLSLTFGIMTFTFSPDYTILFWCIIYFCKFSYTLCNWITILQKEQNGIFG